MRKFFHITFIPKLLQLSILPCFDFQGLKKNNVHDVTVSGVPHSTQIKTCYIQDSHQTSRVQTAVKEKISGTYSN